MLARTEKGEEFVIARGGKPIAKLTGLDEPKLRTLGFAPPITIPDSYWEPLPEDELRRWEGQ